MQYTLWLDMTDMQNIIDAADVQIFGALYMSSMYATQPKYVYHIFNTLLSYSHSTFFPLVSPQMLHTD